MTAQGNTLSREHTGWSWPIDVTSYDRSPHLTAVERQTLALVAGRSGGLQRFAKRLTPNLPEAQQE
jgi:hypothetical protein